MRKKRKNRDQFSFIKSWFFRNKEFSFEKTHGEIFTKKQSRIISADLLSQCSDSSELQECWEK